MQLELWEQVRELMVHFRWVSDTHSDFKTILRVSAQIIILNVFRIQTEIQNIVLNEKS